MIDRDNGKRALRFFDLLPSLPSRLHHEAAVIQKTAPPFEFVIATHTLGSGTSYALDYTVATHTLGSPFVARMLAQISSE